MKKAAVMLVIKNGFILGVSRKYDHTKFGLCGGKLENNGESPIEAAIRETYEETGIKVTFCSFLHNRIETTYFPNKIQYNTYCFYANTWEGELASSEEGEPKWLLPRKLISPESGAFPDYNLITLLRFKQLYPEIFLKDEDLIYKISLENLGIQPL